MTRLLHILRTGARRRRSPAVAAVAVALVLSFAWPSAPVDAGATDDALTVKELPERWRVWLEEEVYPLITREQKRAFLTLDTEAQRQAFAERLWILWGRQTGYGSTFRARYQERLAFARAEFDSTTNDMARVLLIQGPPAFRFRSKCTEFFNPLEIWGWPYIEGLGEGVVVLFYQSGGMGNFRMWYATEGRRVLTPLMVGADSRGFPLGNTQFDSPRYRCPDGDTLMNLIAAAELWARDPTYLMAMTQYRPPNRGKGEEGAANRFMEFSALVDSDAEPLDFGFGEESWGSIGGMVHMNFTLSVDGNQLGTTPVGDTDVIQLDVIGEISRHSHMVDRFRYVFSVPATDQALGLAFERFVRPGDYTLRLKVEDVHSNRAGVAEHEFTASPEATAMPPGIEPWQDELDLEADAAVEVNVAEEQPLLKLVGPEGEGVSGLRRFEAVVQEGIRRVSFAVNGEEILVKNREPFDVDLDLGPLPRLTTVTAVGFDAGGRELARDQLSLNVGRERFYLHLLPISPADQRDGQVRLSIDLNVPTDTRLESLELYWNDERVATLTSPPYEAWVRLEGGGDFGYVRAVATMADGQMAEDLQFVNAPEFGSVVDVRAIELPVTVLDKGGRPVEDLHQEDFQVFEDGVLQEISHFALHRDLPIRLGLVIDTSGSMTDTLPTVQRVVMGFLRDLLRPRDRAYIETFSDKPDLLAPFTADFTTLENALLSLFADRETALYDAMVMGMFQFSGVRGRRAMVVLTDGEDTTSKYQFEDVIRYAQRAGVTIYTIGVNLPVTKVSSRWQLNKLAEVTGGQSYFVSDNTDLERIYAEIDRELRTQYLIAYTSSSEKPSEELRKIKVDVDQRGVKVRTISGYYPGGV